MSESWIKLRDDLDSDPRVFTMADALRRTAGLYVLQHPAKDLFGSVTEAVTEAVTRNVMRDVTVAGLSRVWFAANRHTTDGVFHNATLEYLDTLSQVPGFGAAMQLVNYADYDPTTRTVTLPRFGEYNAPNKNGHRSKTAAARRAQRHRDKLKANAQAQLPEPPTTTAFNEGNTVTQCDTVTLRVTPSVTSRHDESDVTPSISSSLSISTSDSDSPPDTTLPAESGLEALKARVNALRPQTWKRTPHWSAEDESALFDARQNLVALDAQDWLLLTWFFRWANSSANSSAKDPVKVTARRHVFCTEISAYLDRATAIWKQAGSPRLLPHGQATAGSRPPPQPPSPELPPAQNAAAFAGILADHGVNTHSRTAACQREDGAKVPTKPAA